MCVCSRSINNYKVLTLEADKEPLPGLRYLCQRLKSPRLPAYSGSEAREVYMCVLHGG